MTPNDNDRFPVRKNPRMKQYDYTSHNYYFTTICTRDKLCLFGSPAKLSPMGEIAADCLRNIPAHFPGVMIDKWVVMPNHIHAIVILPGSTVNLSNVIGQYTVYDRYMAQLAVDAYSAVRKTETQMDALNLPAVLAMMQHPVDLEKTLETECVFCTDAAICSCL